MANFLTLNGNHVGKAPTISSKLMDITVTLVSSGWDSTTKKQVVTIPDMPSTAMPVVVPLDSDLTNYALLDGMDIEAGKITFIASEVPSGDINIMLKGVVASKQDMVALTQGYVNRLSVLETQNGTETLTTESKTLSGGVNEIKSSLANITNVTSGTTSASGITYTQCGKLVIVHIKSLAKTTGNVTLTGLPTPATGDYISCYVGNGLTIVGYVEWNNYKWIYYSGEVSFGSFMYIAQ